MSTVQRWPGVGHDRKRQHNRSTEQKKDRNGRNPVDDWGTTHLDTGEAYNPRQFIVEESQTQNEEYTLLDFAAEFSDIGNDKIEDHMEAIEIAEETQREKTQDLFGDG
jgi:hypothetical protein